MSAESAAVPAEPGLDTQSVVSRVASLPLVSCACGAVAAAYGRTKERHPSVGSVCSAAEKGLRTLTAAAASGAQPLLTRLEPQISTANKLACRGLDKLEEKLPMLQQPPERIISDTKLLVTSTVTGARDVLTSTVAGARDAVSNTMAGARDAVSGTVAGAKDAVSSTVSGARDAVSSTVSGARDAVSSTVAGARDAVSSTVTGAKDAVTSRVTGVMDMTKGAVQGGVEMTRSAVSSGVSTVGQMVASRVDSMLGKSEELVDHYLPLTDGELAQLATAVEGFEPEQQRQQQSYFVRLGSLSSKVRQRALQHSLSKLQSARQSCQDQLAQLQRTLDLVETLKQGVDQKLQGGQEKLQQLWLEWSKKQPDGGKDQVPPEAVESGTVSMLQGLSQQLQSSCQPLVCSLQGLPAAVQDKAGQVRHNVEGLRAALGSVRSLQDVTGPVLARARDHAAQARLLMDELVEQVAFNTPLTWLVGPFAPSGKRPVEPEAE
uniref:Perilipin n=1 Tax=Junco hyemalis TaxID=40217 RepID=A0A8C5IV36_JUNHY